MTHKSSRLDNWLLPLLVLMLIAYAAPWVVTPSAGMTVGGYDFAEWTSLHPTVRDTSPALLLTLLLRLPLACIGVIAAFSVQRDSATWRSIVFTILALATAIASLPPAEFFTVSRDDFNYQQQFTLAVAITLGILMGLSGKLGRIRLWVITGVAFLGAGASSLGINQGCSLMSSFALPVHIGAGGVALISLFAICLLLIAVSAAEQRSHR